MFSGAVPRKLHRCEWFQIANLVAPGSKNFQLWRVVGQSERKGEAARAGEHVGGDAKTFWIAGNVVEQ